MSRINYDYFSNNSVTQYTLVVIISLFYYKNLFVNISRTQFYLVQTENFFITVMITKNNHTTFMFIFTAELHRTFYLYALP